MILPPLVFPALTFKNGFQRNGADFSVFLNTSSDYDGSDSGAKPDEAVSWGKIRMDATPVKVFRLYKYGYSWYFYLRFKISQG